MKKLISYPKIAYFFSMAKLVRINTRYMGENDDGEPVYDNSVELPTITFTGSIKTHGTNASVCYNHNNGMWYQNRKNIITIGRDNAGFAFFADSRKEVLKNHIQLLATSNQIDLNENTIVIYGEFIGKGIQRGVAVSELDKRLIVFGVKVAPHDEERESFWVSCEPVKSHKDDIYNKHDFGEYKININFNEPKLSQNKIINMTKEVERECPVGKFFNVSGVGEGIVFTASYKGNNYRFKSKGDKHSKSKVKKLKVVDEILERRIIETVNAITHAWRIDQAVDEVCGDEFDIKMMGDIIRWVLNNTYEEEREIIIESNLEPKQMNGRISKIIRDYLFKNYVNDFK